MKRGVTFKGEPYTLSGMSLEPGRAAPNFRVVGGDLKEVSLGDFGRTTKVVTSFLSLDTGVCEIQLKEFNRRAALLSKDVVVLAVSKDLPFAQKRFCESHGVHNAQVVSDYKYSSFGINYGVLIMEMNLLARSVFIIDGNNDIQYIQIVNENSREPDYDGAFVRLEDILSQPLEPVRMNFSKWCLPCEGGAEPLSGDQVNLLLTGLQGWRLMDGGGIFLDVKFESFGEAKFFMDLVAVLAEEHNHHPVMALNYNRLNLTLVTHAVNGLTKNDFAMARLINALLEREDAR